MLETNWIELNVAADGTVTWRESANVYQFSNETVGVRIYTPFDPHSESALINIRLPDDTVLQEKAMTYAGYDTVEGVVVHKWQYLFGDLVTALTGYDYAASIVLAFRALDASNGQSKTTNQISVPIQPSIQGESLYVDPDTADVMNAKIDKNSGDIEDLNKTVGDIFDAAVSAKEYAEQANTNSEKAVEDSANAVQIANKVREDFDQIAESELGIVQEKGQGTAVAMSQKAVTDALLETVEVSELSGEILTIPNTAEGSLEDYRILGKSVQDGTPSPDSPVEIQSVLSPINVVSCGRNFLDLNRVKVFDNWVLEDSFYYFDIYLKPDTQYNFNCSSNLGTDSNVYLAVVAVSTQPIINSSLPEWNNKRLVFTTPSSGLCRLRLTNASSHDTNNIFVNLLPNCQINEGTTALPYEPYQSVTTEITVTGEDGTVYPLRGIGDVHDEVDFDRNVLIKRVGEYVWSGEGVFGQQSTYDSDLTTVFFSSYLHANQNCKAITDNVERSAVLFDRFPIDMSIYTAKDSQGAFISSNVTFRINKSIANTANDFKAWLAENPVTVVYPLAEPVEIPLQTLPAIPTMDGTTTITTTNTPAPELYCTEYMDAQMGNPVTLKSLNEVINPVTSAELVYNRNTKNTVARDITELQMKNTDQDKQIDTLNEKLYSTDPTKVIPVKKAETANVVPLKYLLDTIYPVGSIYISTVDNSPMNFLGGTWTKLTGDAYLKIVTSGAGNYGGTSSEHKIPLESIPDHSHTYTKTNLNSEETHYMSVGSGTSYAANEDVTTGSAGGGQAYYPYYYGVYVWQRVPD